METDKDGCQGDVGSCEMVRRVISTKNKRCFLRQEMRSEGCGICVYMTAPPAHTTVSVEEATNV